MKRRQSVSHSFLRLPVSKKILKYQVIHDLMAAITTFSTPPVTYTVQQTLITDLKTKAHTALSKTIGTVDAMRLAEAAIDAAMVRLADYVDSIALGNANLIESTGFDSTKAESTPSNVPSEVEGFKFTNVSQVGSVKLSIKSMGGGKSVTYILGNDLSGVHISGNAISVPKKGEGNIFIVSDTHKETMITGLPSGSIQALCYSSNVKGSGPLSSVIQFATN